MDDIKEMKTDIRREVTEKLAQISQSDLDEKSGKIEMRLFEFANFLESKIVLFYTPLAYQVKTANILARCRDYDKIVVLPAFNPETRTIRLMKVDDIKNDLVPGPRGNLEPDSGRCKEVPIECIDLAIIPGVAFDEKGGRIGQGEGYYDRFLPNLPITTRKVALAFEAQFVDQIPMESHDKYVDIIITEDRTIYKI